MASPFVRRFRGSAVHAIGKLGAHLVAGRVPDRDPLRNDQSSRTPAERNPSVYSLKNRGSLQKKSSRTAVPVV